MSKRTKDDLLGKNRKEVAFSEIEGDATNLGAMDVGEWIHENIKKQRMKLNCHLTTSLMDMYSKCGNLEKALELKSGPMLLLLPMYYVLVVKQKRAACFSIKWIQHYACMVDILGRAGLLEEAVEFIEKMPITHSASLELEPKNDGALVLLSNIYAKTGKWDNVSKLKKRMRVSSGL
ncbi:hypothetical protein EZV62_028020 [Acer yangbiense]|uniref:Pentatricopeptide repeat-containing protein n=1 Tax=Acer yangbiense TaxID=1000413 RepID=A0A5C7GPG2_9ROSI|nr:hypothetical protein EZV62_028020 [Acer yangbiense]